MSTHLTPGQHALLQTELRLTRERIEKALSLQLEGESRVVHAQAMLALDPHETREHVAERELDLDLTDRLTAELRQVDDALQRLERPGWGRCVDCGADIPFDRLVHQPQAQRCLDCQVSHEAAAR